MRGPLEALGVASFTVRARVVGSGGVSVVWLSRFCVERNNSLTYTAHALASPSILLKPLIKSNARKRHVQLLRTLLPRLDRRGPMLRGSWLVARGRPCAERSRSACGFCTLLYGAVTGRPIP